MGNTQGFYDAVKDALNGGVDEIVSNTDGSLEIRCKDGHTVRLLPVRVDIGVGLDVQFTRYWADLIKQS